MLHSDSDLTREPNHLVSLVVILAQA
jgi:hypothetical protein